MRTTLKLLTVLALALAAAGLYAPAALAAPPANDLSSGATLVTVGFSELLDTTEATTDAEDAQLNETCGAPATDASVWYVLEGTGQGVIVDVSQSDYSAGVLVGVGSPGSLVTVACSPAMVAFFAEAGTTYYILAIDDQFDGGGNGGTLSISFSEAPPPPTLELTLDRFGTFDARTGTATVSGTYTCTGGDFVDIFVEARQTVGRFTIFGFGGFFDFGTCDGTPHDWSAQVFPQNGKFAGGKALTITFGITCGVFQCADAYLEQTVILRGRK